MPSLTVVTATNYQHELTEFAINKTLNNVPANEVLTFCDKKLNINGHHHNIDLNDVSKKIIADPAISCISDVYMNEDAEFNVGMYSLLNLRGLYGAIETDFALMIQYDGFATNKFLWSNEYFDYDYIGPPTHLTHAPALYSLTNHYNKMVDLYKQNGENNEFLKKCIFNLKNIIDVNKNKNWFNGGGGFSLRSKKLLDILHQETDLIRTQTMGYSCEDLTISLILRPYLEKKYGIKFAPVDLCFTFATEMMIPMSGVQTSLGFHGFQLIPYFLSEEESLFYFKNYIKYNPTFKGSGHELLILNQSVVNKNYKRLKSFLDQNSGWSLYFTPSKYSTEKKLDYFNFLSSNDSDVKKIISGKDIDLGYFVLTKHNNLNL